MRASLAGSIVIALGCGASPPPAAPPAPPPTAPAATAEAPPPPREEVCLASGWCVQHPLPTAQTLNGIWGTASDDVLVVGAGGTALRWDGAAWSSLDTGTTRGLSAVWGSGPRDVHAVGDEGTLLHSDGTAWSILQASLTSSHLRAVWGHGPGHAVAVGSDGVILRWDGARWTRESSGTTAMLGAVWGRAPDDVWAGGHEGTLLHFDGAGWERVALPASGAVRSIHGVGDVLLVGIEGDLWQRAPDGAWTQGPEEGWFQVDAMWGDSLETLHAIDMGKLVRRAADGRWTELLPRGSGECLALWASRPDDVWCVGRSGTLHRVGPDGPATPRPRLGDLTGIWAADDAFAIAVGLGGVALHYDGVRWTPREVPPVRHLYDVWGADREHAWAVGADGRVVFFDGAAWTEQPSNVETPWLSAIAGSAADDVWAVGGEGAIAHFDGTAWSRIESGTTATLLGLWVRARDDAHAFVEGGGTLHWDGAAWRSVPASDEPYPLAELGRAERVFARMNRPELAFDGRAWRWVRPTLGAHVYARVAGDDAWYGASGGVVHRFDGRAWAATSPPLSEVRAISAATPTSVFVAGANGMILHWDGRALARRDERTLEALHAADRARAGEVAALLREARGHARRGRHREARAVLARARAIDEQNATVWCEHGWAAFQDHELAEAEASLARGAALARAPSTRGACLYNLGRVAEARGRRAVAIERYHASLAVRPNELVRRRLEALGATPRAAGAWEVECAPEEAFAGPAAVCAHLEGWLGESAEADRLLGCADGVSTSFAGGGELVWVNRHGFHVDASLLVHRDGGAWRVIGAREVHETWNYDNVGSDDTLELLGVREVVAGGLPELVFATRHTEFDSSELASCDEDDCDDAEVYESSSEGLLVCGRGEARWACARGRGDLPDDLARLLASCERPR